MQRMAAAAIFVGLAIFGAKASSTNALVHGTTWSNQDHWKLYAYDGADGTGNQIGFTNLSYSQITPYWDSSVGKYRVPLSVFCEYPENVVSVKSVHYNLTVGSSESMIEILD